jgi:hypothetical protein
MVLYNGYNMGTGLSASSFSTNIRKDLTLNGNLTMTGNLVVNNSNVLNTIDALSNACHSTDVILANDIISLSNTCHATDLLLESSIISLSNSYYPFSNVYDSSVKISGTSITLNSNVTVTGTTNLNGGVTISGSTQLNNWLNVTGTLGVGTNSPQGKLDIYPTTSTLPALYLRNGDFSAAYTKPQIAFSYNATTAYNQYIHTRHHTTPELNAIDFYICNGTSANSLTANSTLMMSVKGTSVAINSNLDVSGITTISNSLLVKGSNVTDLLGTSATNYSTLSSLYTATSNAVVSLSANEVGLSNSFVTLSNNFVSLSANEVGLSNSFVTLSNNFVSLSANEVGLSNSFVTLSNSFVSLSNNEYALSNAFVSFKGNVSTNSVTTNTLTVNNTATFDDTILVNSPGGRITINDSSINTNYNLFVNGSARVTSVGINTHCELNLPTEPALSYSCLNIDAVNNLTCGIILQNSKCLKYNTADTNEEWGLYDYLNSKWVLKNEKNSYTRLYHPLDMYVSPTTTPVLSLRNGDNNAGGSGYSQIRFSFLGNLGDYAHYIRTRHNAGAATGNAIDFLTCDSSKSTSVSSGVNQNLTLDGGNVGIATYTPNYKLHVVGDGYFSSLLTRQVAIVTYRASTGTIIANTTVNAVMFDTLQGVNTANSTSIGITPDATYSVFTNTSGERRCYKIDYSIAYEPLASPTGFRSAWISRSGDSATTRYAVVTAIPLSSTYFGTVLSGSVTFSLANNEYFSVYTYHNGGGTLNFGMGHTGLNLGYINRISIVLI